MRVRESLVLLTQDNALASALRAVCAAEHELVVVQAEADLAQHLMADAAGVVVLDTAAAVSPVAQLTQSLKTQFPDVVLIVAGGAYEQAAVTAQVTNGVVYRFLHKPASEQRIRLFVDAAWRRRSSEFASGGTTTLTKLAEPPAPRRLAPKLSMAVLAVAAAAGLGGWLMGQHGRRMVAAPAPHSAPRPAVAPAPASDAVLAQLLANAAQAFTRGDFILPAGSSAADLYRQALERHRGDPQAQAGLDKVLDQILSAAEQDLLAQHLDEAEHLTQAARAIAPDSVRVAFLATQTARERERVTHAQARLQSQQQQQQADELARQQKSIATARAALAAGNLDEAARLIGAAADSGADREATDALTRDLQEARLLAKLNDTLAKAAPVKAIETAPLVVPQAAPLPAAHVDEVVSASTLERLKYVAPEFPMSARERGISGWVDLEFDVQTDGAVDGITVVAADPKDVFDRAAVTAVRKWRYQPVLRDGHAVVRRARLRIRFAVQ